MKVLIVDDNKNINDVLVKYCKRKGYETIVAYDGEEAINISEKENLDLILLDVMLPKLEGFEVCKKIREKSNIPIIMITAKSEDMDRIMGLDIGADDYIIKPFSPAEVMARIRAIMRRIGREIVVNTNKNIIKYGNLKIDIDRYSVFIDEYEVSLTKVVIIDKNSENVVTGGEKIYDNYKNMKKEYVELADKAFLGQKGNFNKNNYMMAYSPVFGKNKNVVGAVILKRPISFLNSNIKNIIMLIMASILISIFLSVIIGLLVSIKMINSLTVIRSMIEALSDEVFTDEEEKSEMIEKIKDESIYMQRLVNDTLELSRFQNSEFKINFEEINILDVVSDAIRTIRRIAKTKEIEVILYNENSAIYVNGDYMRLRQLIIILGDNAIKFSENGDKVEVRVKQIDEKVRVSIKDYGCGIDCEYKESIFERFSKSKDESNKIGTGLGLAIAQNIATRHKSLIVVESEVGKGSNFYFDIEITSFQG